MFGKKGKEVKTIKVKKEITDALMSILLSDWKYNITTGDINFKDEECEAKFIVGLNTLYNEVISNSHTLAEYLDILILKSATIHILKAEDGEEEMNPSQIIDITEKIAFVMSTAINLDNKINFKEKLSMNNFHNVSEKKTDTQRERFNSIYSDIIMDLYEEYYRINLFKEDINMDLVMSRVLRSAMYGISDIYTKESNMMSITVIKTEIPKDTSTEDKITYGLMVKRLKCTRIPFGDRLYTGDINTPDDENLLVHAFIDPSINWENTNATLNDAIMALSNHEQFRDFKIVISRINIPNPNTIWLKYKMDTYEYKPEMHENIIESLFNAPRLLDESITTINCDTREETPDNHIVGMIITQELIGYKDDLGDDEKTLFAVQSKNLGHNLLSLISENPLMMEQGVPIGDGIIENVKITHLSNVMINIACDYMWYAYIKSLHNEIEKLKEADKEHKDFYEKASEYSKISSHIELTSIFITIIPEFIKDNLDNTIVTEGAMEELYPETLLLAYVHVAKIMISTMVELIIDKINNISDKTNLINTKAIVELNREDAHILYEKIVSMIQSDGFIGDRISSITESVIKYSDRLRNDDEGQNHITKVFNLSGDTFPTDSIDYDIIAACKIIEYTTKEVILLSIEMMGKIEYENKMNEKEEEANANIVLN